MNYFETKRRRVTLLDAPGHRDFVSEHGCERRAVTHLSRCCRCQTWSVVRRKQTLQCWWWTPRLVNLRLALARTDRPRSLILLLFIASFSRVHTTQEHAVLARSLGVTQLIVAVNKMDVVDWAQERFDAICTTLAPFLKLVRKRWCFHLMSRLVYDCLSFVFRRDFETNKCVTCPSVVWLVPIWLYLQRKAMVLNKVCCI